MFPLTNHSRDFVTVVDVFLIPVDPRRASEDLVGVDVPILKALYPVDASVVGPQCLVDVAAFVVVVVHVWIQLTEAVTGRASEEAFEDVPTHVVKVVTIVVQDTPSVVGVHDLAPGLSATILVEKWS